MMSSWAWIVEISWNLLDVAFIGHFDKVPVILVGNWEVGISLSD
jgi:hypothetical protein